MHGKQGSAAIENIKNIYLYSDGMSTVLRDKAVMKNGYDIDSLVFEKYIQKNRSLTTDDITILQLRLKGE